MNLDDKYAYLLVSNNPDNKIEYFWYYYKQIIINYIETITKSDITIYIFNIVDKLSKHFNKLQEKKRYTDIEFIIRQFILITPFILLPIYFLNHSSDKYKQFINLWKTHIKRWNLISTCNTLITLQSTQLKCSKDKLEKYSIIYTTLIKEYPEFINNEIIKDINIVIDNIDLYVSFIIKSQFYIKLYDIFISSLNKLFINKEIGILEYIYAELNIIELWISNIYIRDIEKYNQLNTKLLLDSQKSIYKLSLTKFFKLYGHLISNSDF